MKVSKLDPNATIPFRKNFNDAGADLYALGDYIIHDGMNKIIHTGITCEIPEGCIGWITNKSSKDYLIGGGIVDEGYQGELLVKIINVTDSTLVIRDGDAIAQLLILPVKILDIVETPFSEIHQNKSDRGSDGGIVRQTKE